MGIKVIIWCFLSELKFSTKKSDASGWVLSNVLEQKRETVINSLKLGILYNFCRAVISIWGSERAGAQWLYVKALIRYFSSCREYWLCLIEASFYRAHNGTTL